jgi:hypothetical protein
VGLFDVSHIWNSKVKANLNSKLTSLQQSITGDASTPTNISGNHMEEINHTTKSIQQITEQILIYHDILLHEQQLEKKQQQTTKRV